MNIAQLLGELESAVSQAKTAGNRVQKAIEELKSVFGSLGVTAESVSVVEPTLPIENGIRYVCPYCKKEFAPYRRPHRDSPKFPERYRVSRHIGTVRRTQKDHGELGAPIPW